MREEKLSVPTPVLKVELGLLRRFRPVRKSAIKFKRSMVELARNPDLAARLLKKM